MKRHPAKKTMNQKHLRSKGQLSFFGPLFRTTTTFGGSLHRNSNPKRARPVSTKHPMHIVLRSSVAHGPWSMRGRRLRLINRLIESEARRFHIRLHQYANVSNHLHLLLKIRHRSALAAFLRSLSGRIAMLITGSRKGLLQGGRFWDYRPFSRIVSSYRAYRHTLQYIWLNQREAGGEVIRETNVSFRRHPRKAPGIPVSRGEPARGEVMIQAPALA